MRVSHPAGCAICHERSAETHYAGPDLFCNDADACRTRAVDHVKSMEDDRTAMEAEHAAAIEANDEENHRACEVAELACAKAIRNHALEHEAAFDAYAKRHDALMAQMRAGYDAEIAVHNSRIVQLANELKLARAGECEAHAEANRLFDKLSKLKACAVTRVEVVGRHARSAL
jgi:hypothetical protein